MDGDFDVLRRSADGCIRPLLTMARLGGNNAERDAALAEQEVRIRFHNNNIISSCQEVIAKS